MPSLTYRVVRYALMPVRGAWVDAYDIAQRHLDFHTACHDARELLKEAMWRADSFGEQRCPRLFVQCETIPASEAHTVLTGDFTFMA